MAFPPQFLDELRSRVALAAVIQRRTKLVRKGREYSGLCPFHNEKSPSFTVNEDKGFYHCFGCGAHGDVIGFVMRAENKSFVEAIEGLAAEAGVAMPQQTPEARREAARQADLYDVTERAAAYFEAQLRAPGGAEARNYLERRGVSAEMLARFRIGYAPSGTGLLRQHLLANFPEPLVAEAGLIGYREGETASFDYFRQRVMFPIADRSGRIIGFGGRVLGDAKPKYLNSPETPVFHKGSVLYGHALAREAARQGAQAIVTEGYLDVVALHQAGFGGAVAPLGTALTELQLAELWKLVAEPILCFDGDAAGARAAGRALERALPLLKPGRSLRFVTLPAGEDPDSLVRRSGAQTMRHLLDRAVSLGEFVWASEVQRQPPTTPERRAELAARLAAHAAQVQDETLRREYQSFFRRAVYERLRPAFRGSRKLPVAIAAPLPPEPRSTARRRQESIMVLILRHPELLDEVLEEFVAVELTDPALDHLRREVINAFSRGFGLDANSLAHHLSASGLAEEVEALTARRVLEHARFALSGDREQLIAGWKQVLGFMRDADGPASEMHETRDEDTHDLGSIVDRVNAIQAEILRRRQAENDAAIRTDLDANG